MSGDNDRTKRGTFSSFHFHSSISYIPFDSSLIHGIATQREEEGRTREFSFSSAIVFGEIGAKRLLQSASLSLSPPLSNFKSEPRTSPLVSRVLRSFVARLSKDLSRQW